MATTFDGLLQSAHIVALDVDVLDPFTGQVLASLSPRDGGVTLDAQAAVRGRLDMTVDDDGTGLLIPTDAGSLLAPYGNQIQVKRGIQFPNGTTELYGLGIFRIDDAPITDSGAELAVRLTGQDQAAIVADAKFEEDRKVKAGQLFTQVIEDLVREVLPDVEIRFTATSITTPSLTASRGDDRWAFVQGMATAIGGELFFDGDGVLVLQPIPSLGAPASAVISEGDGGMLLGIERGFTREKVFNRVVLTGDGHPDDPIESVATDDDPTSPTYYYGKFRPKPYFYNSQFITAQAQADDAAQGILQTLIGADQPISFSSVVDPRLQPSAVVKVQRDRIGVDETHILDSITIPLVVTDSSSATTRKTGEVFA